MVGENRDLAGDFQAQFNDVLTRLQSKQLFQSDWDIAAFAIFFIFIGMVVLLFILVLIRCFCCCCCDSAPHHKKLQNPKVGVDNLAMEP
ncbi:small integral membrane protein 22 [Protopterus annectens]|uniref:small integral membrane protein 22 n=1 Tax=Protopterus annectens TaxID=7888 RepID=UPI001CFB1EA2|nr:small integral membrane protein 22 [Protopterus annectens]